MRAHRTAALTHAARDRRLFALRESKGRERLQNLELLLTMTFPAAEVLTPRTLSPSQRQTLEALVALDIDVALPRQGIPNVASVRTLLASATSGATTRSSSAAGAGTSNVSAIDSEMTLSPGTRPLWQWFEAEFNGEISDEELTRAVLDRFTSDGLWDVAESALREERGHAAPTMSFSEHLSAHVTVDDDRIASFIEGAASAGPDCSPSRATFGVLVLARAGSPAKHRKAVEQLASIVTGGNDDVVIDRVLASLPTDIRSRIVF